ncbi:MAG: pitrilysin family protein [Bacteroidales bacterium]|nr:pitrilysin family protein [Bacteroidales bacterium]
MYQYHTLNNGIRIVFRQKESIVAHAGVYVNVGSRDEQGAEEGLAHFIEHSIFKGTTHRKSYHILNRIDGVGGELNAFTTKESTCIYTTSLSIHLERCLELMSDIIFNSNFPENEIAKEKDVVLEEINSYEDYPAELIYDDFEYLAFEGHPLAHNILGTKKNVKKFTTNFIREFFTRNYTPDRMVITVVGNIDFKKLVRILEHYFGCYKPLTSSIDRSTPPQFHQFNTTIHKKTHQVHALIGCSAYNSFDEKKVGFTLINNLLGGPAMNSRLNVAIREKYGFCYTIESQYTPFTDAGLFYIYAGIEPEAKEKYIELVLKELNRFKEKPLSTLQLHTAQQQLIAQIAIDNDLSLNEMQSIGKAHLLYNRVDTLEEMSNDIESITAQEIQDIANELFVDNNLSFLFYN